MQTPFGAISSSNQPRDTDAKRPYATAQMHLRGKTSRIYITSDLPALLLVIILSD